MMATAFAVAAMFAAAPSATAQQAGEQPIITLKTNIYDTYGAENSFHIVLGSTETDYFDVDCGFGMVEAEVSPWVFDTESQAISGTSIQCRVSEEGLVKIYGDPTKIDYIDCEGCYLDWVDIEQLSNLEIIDMSHNELKRLDLSPFTKLYAVYLSDNPFTAETPLVVGSNHPSLAILEMDIMEHIDQSFNLSDYPELVTFDGYHNTDLRKVDPTGCPKLQVLSVELTPVESIDVTKNPRLTRLNISESRITSIDLSQNTALQYLLCGHDSGTFNSDVKLESLDVTHNPNLMYLSAQGNGFTSIDVSKNTNLTHLMLQKNHLTEIDLSNNPYLYLVNIANNDFTFATLPAPDPNWGEYYYYRDPLPCDRSYAVNTPIDFSAEVLRPSSVTTARAFTVPYDGEPVELEADAFTFADGKVTFNTIPSDSVYVQFANSVFEMYTIRSGNFKVKNASEMGQPSDVLAIRVGATRPSDNFGFGIGLDSSASGKNDFVVRMTYGETSQDFTFTASSTTAPDADNVNLSLPAGQDVTLTVLMPENSVLTALSINGKPGVESVDLTRATELRTLAITGCSLADVDMRYNRCLTSIDLSDNNLTALDLSGVYGNYEKFALRTVKASNNRIADFTIVNTRSIYDLDLSHNQLSSLVLKDYDAMRNLDLSYNMLIEDADLTYMTAAETINISNNNYTSVTTVDMPSLRMLDVSDNALTIATLPYLPSVAAGAYVYAPQKQLEIVSFAPAVNISEQYRVIDGEGTRFVWRNVADGAPLVEGTDVDCTNGATKFLAPAIGKTVYCEMSHPAFPEFAGADIFRTTDAEVVDVPKNVVASFTTTKAVADAEVIFRGHKRTALYIDWRGDGTEYKQYTVGSDTYTSYPEQVTYEGAEVKVYTYEDAADIMVFSVYNAPMSRMDASALTALTAFSVGDAGLDEETLVFPATTALTELNLLGNNFSKKDFSEYTNLAILNLGRNQYETFDVSAIPSLQALYMDQNKLTGINLANEALWSLSLLGNKLSYIDFTNATSLTQINLAVNEFETIDLSPLRRRLQAIFLEHNRFTFATLPRLSQLPNLRYFTYGNQAEVQIECVDGKVDLSAQAQVDGIDTQYDWYLGDISYDEDNDLIIGELLEGTGDDPEYTVEDGITTFHYSFNEPVRCLMTNTNYPNLVLYTSAVMAEAAGVENVAVDSENADAPVDVYTISGVLLRTQVAPAEATRGLAPGIYVVGGRKVAVR